jgi:GGDEF domain-containing protein
MGNFPYARPLGERALRIIAERKVTAMQTEIEALRAENERLTREANTDPLTGLLNLRGFYTETAKTLEILPDEANVLIVAVDMSKFKEINDYPGWGHDIGDAALKIAADVLRSIVRSKPRPENLDYSTDSAYTIDHVARLGGDEFAFELAFTGRATYDQAYAQEVTQKIITTKLDIVTKAVINTIIDNPDPSEYPGIARLGNADRDMLKNRIRLNAGSVVVPAKELRGDGLQKHLAVADAEMYIHKEASRSVTEEQLEIVA